MVTDELIWLEGCQYGAFLGIIPQMGTVITIFNFILGLEYVVQWEGIGCVQGM
ncbi:hypothetical protein CLU79DRAFT_427144 [Phycomyces nitens]|nr:hypothetical protein CLU79DRAFT_427144 [Phycomyces nitens]